MAPTLLVKIVLVREKVLLAETYQSKLYIFRYLGEESWRVGERRDMEC
jgi:hypothetical protein